MEEVFYIIIIILVIVFLLSMLTGIALGIIRKIYLIKSTLKNRKFDDKRLVNKINEFVNAIFHDPDYQHFFRRKHRVNFITKEEYQLNDKLCNYFKLTFRICVISLLTAFLIGFIFALIKSI